METKRDEIQGRGNIRFTGEDAHTQQQRQDTFPENGTSARSEYNDESSSSSSSSEDEGKRRRFRSSRKGKSGMFSRFSMQNEDMGTTGKVSKKDGRLNITVDQKNEKGWMAKALSAGIMQHIGQPEGGSDPDPQDQMMREKEVDEALHRRPTTLDNLSRPKMNIVVMVIGSRGDIQPFIKVGKILQDEHGHRVRIATHPAFKDFVEKECGLEFFSVGGDPSELMAFMVKNPGMIPKAETIRKGEIGRRRDGMFEMFQGMWRACINATDDETDKGNKRMMTEQYPFVADAIIANPPSFAHIHCAEALGCPLHLMFTFPYTPTTEFPSPLANIKKTNTTPAYANFMSYPLVDMMTWQGLGDLVNKFRTKTLGLEPVSTLWAPGQLYRLKVPYTYMWSPGLCPKPKDWGPEIDIVGFSFLELASSFKPPKELTEFLDAGEPPVYIGFGSIVVDDAAKFTKLIFDAVKMAGVRALVSKGWGGLGDEKNTPDNIHMLGNVPHDWLFPKCKAVIHHGGAGTTAAGLKMGLPTMIVPFFGDQPFWGSRVAEKRAGAFNCIPYKELTVEKLAEGIKQCLTKEAKENVMKIAKSIKAEGDGAANAVNSFHANLPMRSDADMRCSIFPEKPSVWQYETTKLRLSALAATLLVEQKKFRYHDLNLIRHYEWNDFQGPGDPLTGGTSAVMKDLVGFGRSLVDAPIIFGKDIDKKVKHDKKKKRHERIARERGTTLKQLKEERSSAEEDDLESDDSLPNIDQHSHQATQDEDNYSSFSDSDGAVRGNGRYQQAQEHLGSGHQANSNRNSGHDDGHLSAIEHRQSPPRESTGKTSEQQQRMEHAREQQQEEMEAAQAHRPAPPQHADSNMSILSADDSKFATHLARDTAAGLVKPVGIIAKAPMDLLLGVSQGFHNAPRLYGDDTVRRPIRITSLATGLKAAGSELVLGTYDAFTGVVTQPYRGARERGVTGFVSGVGKGLGGLVLKEASAVTAPLGFAMKGVQKEIETRHGRRTPQAFICRARKAQGLKEYRELFQAEGEAGMERARHTVEEAWKVEEQILSEAMRVKGEGRGMDRLKGHLRLSREKTELDKRNAFENVHTARAAVMQRKLETGEGGEVA